MAENLRTNKETKEISVDTMYRLCVGKSAKLIAGREMIVTSPVAEIFINNTNSNGGGYAMFETQNTRYIVSYKKYLS